MKCRQCGTEIAEKALICFRCGTAVIEPTIQPYVAKKRRPVVAYAVLVLLVVVAIAVMMLTSMLARD